MTSDRIRRWNERHAQASSSPGEPVALIAEVARKHPPGTALDLACGLGRNALCLARAGWAVTAVDASEVAINRLCAAAASERLPIHTIVADLQSFGFDMGIERFDLICVCFYLQRSLIPRIKTGVRTGGLAAVMLPMFDDTPGIEPMNPDFLVSPGEMLSWFDDWEILEHEEKREPEHGRKTARLIARKPADARVSGTL